MGGLAGQLDRAPILDERPQYITAVRSAIWRTTARSWAMNRVANPSLGAEVRRRRTIWRWVDTSSADTGSSQTISEGLRARARAIGDPLALTAGELGRVAGGVDGTEADLLEQLGDPLARARGRALTPSS